MSARHTTTEEHMMRKGKQYMVNGEFVTYVKPDLKEQCDYCGGFGHQWQQHSEARADVAAWQREAASLEEPFGRHVEY